MANSNLAVSAGVVLYINGFPYAQVTGFRWEMSTPMKAIHGVDVAEPLELAPTTSKVGGTVSLLRSVGDGGLEGLGIVPFHEDLARGKYFSLTLIDRRTGIQLFRADYCSVLSQSWDAPAKARVTGSMTFEALTWRNEAHPK